MLRENVVSVNDFFCGAGGMGLGFKYAGFRLSGAWDFDKWAVESYGNNVSPKVKQMDITQMTGKEIPYADVWTFGFPCQDISIAGKQAGMVKGKTRSGLFYEVMRLLDEVEHKPRVILAENVKAVKKYLPEIEREYVERGYKLYYTLYNSKYWGVPQNRERYFMIGIHESIEEEFVFPEQQTDFIPKLSSVLEDEVDEKYYIDNEKAQKVIEQAKKRVKLKELKIFAERGRLNENGDYKVQREFRKDNVTNTLGQNTGLNMLVEPQINVVGRLDIKGHDYIRRIYNPEGISPTLTASQGGNTHPKVLVPISVMNAVIDGFRVRRLTPREYARLQGFPESFEFHVSDTQLYKQFWNAVTVNVAQAIAERIKEFLLSNN